MQIAWKEVQLYAPVSGDGQVLSVYVGSEYVATWQGKALKLEFLRSEYKWALCVDGVRCKSRWTSVIAAKDGIAMCIDKLLGGSGLVAAQAVTSSRNFIRRRNGVCA